MWGDIKYRTWKTKRALGIAAREAKFSIQWKAAEMWQATSEAKKEASRKLKDALLLSLPGMRNAVPASPVPHLLRCNAPPSEEESALVRKVIEAVKPVMDELLRRAGGGSSMARHKLGFAQRYVQAHRSILSPIRRLPPEILQEIMIHTIPYYSCNSSRRHPYACYTLPWAAAQVCSGWRWTALASPRLWAELPSIRLHPTKPPTPFYLEFLAEILKRSGDCPIEVRINGPYFLGPSHPALELLVAHSDRWKSLDAQIHGRTLPSLRPIKGRLSALQSLDIYICRDTEDLREPLDIFELAPRLQRFRNDNHQYQINLPPSLLIRYDGHMNRVNALQHFSTFSLSLETLVLHCCGGGPPLPIFTLPNLKRLHLQFSGSLGFDDVFLDSLITPSIQEIKIDEASLCMIPRLTRMLVRSGSPDTLETMQIYSPLLDEGWLPALLAQAPKLAELRVNLPPLRDIERLAAPSLVPELRTLELTVEHLDPRADKEVIAALNALALTRFEINSNSDHPITPCPLRLQLNFIEDHIPQVLRPAFERWNDMPGSPNLALAAVYARLVGCIPGAGPPPYPLRENKVKYNTKWLKEVDQVFWDLEDAEVGHARDIYASKLLHLLYRLAKGFIFAAHRGGLEARSQAILDRWNPLLEAHIPECRWFVKGRHSLVYLGQDSVIRQQAKTEDLIYGLDEPRSFPDLLYPSFDHSNLFF